MDDKITLGEFLEAHRADVDNFEDMIAEQNSASEEPLMLTEAQWNSMLASYIKETVLAP